MAEKGLVLTHETRARDSRAAHQSGDACGSGIDRATLNQVVFGAYQRSFKFHKRISRNTVPDPFDERLDDMMDYAIYCEIFDNEEDESGSGGNSGCSVVLVLGAIGSAALSLLA